MTQPDFTDVLEQHLRLCGRPIDRCDVLAFVAGCWPLLADDPDPARWAGEFLQSQQAAQEEWSIG